MVGTRESREAAFAACTDEAGRPLPVVSAILERLASAGSTAVVALPHTQREWLERDDAYAERLDATARKWGASMARLAPGVAAPAETILTAALRTSRKRAALDEAFLAAAFGGVARPRAALAWLRRMELAGIVHCGVRLIARPSMDVWFPTVDVGPSGAITRREIVGRDDRFVASLLSSYRRVAAEAGSFAVDLLRVRDLVCYELRIWHGGFEKALARAVDASFRREIDARIAVEPGRTSEVRAWVGDPRHVPVINHCPVYSLNIDERRSG